jgi:hypothetical protein
VSAELERRIQELEDRLVLPSATLLPSAIKAH